MKGIWVTFNRTIVELKFLVRLDTVYELRLLIVP